VIKKIAASASIHILLQTSPLFGPAKWSRMTFNGIPETT
jgi:hypothetical protein